APDGAYALARGVRELVSARKGREGSRRAGDQLHLLGQVRRSITTHERDPIPPFECMVEAIETNRLLPVSALDGSVACQESVSLCLTLARAVQQCLGHV